VDHSAGGEKEMMKPERYSEILEIWDQKWSKEQLPE
jgi:hypothetical protein